MSIQYACLYEGITNGLAGRMADFAPIFARHGGTDILYPPCQQTQYGGNSSTLGYDPIRDLDVGQFEGFPLRWGTAEEIRQANLIAHKCGVRVEVDWPIHQYGGRAPLYEKGPDGKIDPTLFPKPVSMFLPYAKRDNEFDTDGDAADGLQVSYQGSTPKGYMLEGKIQAGRLHRRWFGWNGFRGDEFKAESIETAQVLARALPGQNFAEVYTGNQAELDSYVRQTGIPVLDFTQHFAYRDVSNGAGLGRLVDSGYWCWNAGKAVIYVESHDTDGPTGVINNKLWFYLHALTMPAWMAQIYAGDFERYNLGDRILNMMWFASTFAFGKLAWEHVEDDLLVWSRDGNGGAVGWSGGMLCVINRDPINKRGLWVHTPFAPGNRLHNYANTYGEDTTVNADGWAYVTVNSNVNGSGQSYAMYAPEGVSRTITPSAVKETISGSLTDFSDFTLKYTS